MKELVLRRPHGERWSLEGLVEQLRYYCVGAVVTREEHARLNNEPTFINPWRRYASAGIEIVEHAGLPYPHRDLLTDAKVLTTQEGYTGLPPTGLV